MPTLEHFPIYMHCIDCPTGGPIWRWPEHKRRHTGARSVNGGRSRRR
jgi:hypothetical protein